MLSVLISPIFKEALGLHPQSYQFVECHNFDFVSRLDHHRSRPEYQHARQLPIERFSAL